MNDVIIILPTLNEKENFDVITNDIEEVKKYILNKLI